MIPGRWLHRFATHCCSAQTRERIVEPLLADFQHQSAATTDRIERVRVWLRGYAAFWTMLALCGGRAALTLPQWVTLDQALVWIYGIAILSVIALGPHWVWTGELSARAGLKGLSRLTPLAPMLVWTRYTAWPPGRPALGRAEMLHGLLAFIVAMLVACWLNPDLSTHIVVMSVGYLVVASLFRRLIKARAS